MMIRKQIISLFLAAVFALILLAGLSVVNINTDSTYAGVIPAQIANNPSGGGNTGG